MSAAAVGMEDEDSQYQYKDIQEKEVASQSWFECILGRHGADDVAEAIMQDKAEPAKEKREREHNTCIGGFGIRTVLLPRTLRCGYLAEGFGRSWIISH